MDKDFDSELKKIIEEGNRASQAIEQMLGALRGAMGGRPFALYGILSPVAQLLLDACADHGLAVACFCDIDGGEGIARTDSGREAPMVSPKTLARDHPDATVAICSFSEDNGYLSELVELGFPYQRVLPWEWTVKIVHAQMSTATSRLKYIDVNMYSWAFDFFQDDVSKQTVLDRLRLNLTGIPFAINTPCRQYFEDGCISLGDREIFVDGGAHHGESAVEFIRQVQLAGAGYAHVYSFEPDSESIKRVAEKTSGHPNVTIVPKGLWSSETELTFYAKGDTLGSSFVIVPDNPEGEGTFIQRVPVTSLDAIFGGMPESEWPTFIKLDIEGAEREALLGAAGVIRRKKPKLAVCVYHKPEDVYVLPKTILGLRDDYRFALRHYQNGPHETVLYAV
jgi:FkbM family methyltransferase